jgi:hypothetical protein
MSNRQGRSAAEGRRDRPATDDPGRNECASLTESRAF